MALRYALRGLWKNPGFSLVAILTLALGIGANTAIFSVVNIFLIRPLPYPEPDRLVSLFERNVVGDEQQMGVAAGNFLDWQKASTTFEQMSAYGARILTFSSDKPGAVAERVGVCACSWNIFATLGVSPLLGRTVSAEEDRFAGSAIAVISYGLWQRQYGGSTDVIGKSIRLDGEDHEIIGVMPRGFMFPNRVVDVWRPLLKNLPPEQQVRHDLHNLGVVGRLRRGLSLEQGRAEIDGISARYKRDHPNEATGKGASAFPLHDQLTQNVRTPLIVLLGAVGCVLLIACVNIAGLVLTRAASQTREIGIRAALGAGRTRIIGQLLTESVMLALAGGVLGAIFAVSITSLLAENAPAVGAFVPSGGVPVDPRVFLFAFAVAAFSGIGVGLFPAIRISRFDLANDLKSGGRSLTATRSHARMRSGLVCVEISLSVVLLVASGLLLHSFFLVYQVQPGVRVDRILTMTVGVPSVKYRELPRRSALFAELGERLSRLPAVQSAGLTSCAPVSGFCGGLFYYVDGRPFVLGKVLSAMELAADPDYFTTAGIPLVRGRTFTKQDGIGFDLKHPRLGSVIISESMARTVFPGEDPIGKRIFFDYEVQRERVEGTPVPHYEIIGVAGDVRRSLDVQPEPMLYRPLLDVAFSVVTVVLHTAAEPKAAITDAQNEIRRIDPDLSVSRIQTMDEVVNASTAGRKFNMTLFAAFAGLALLLAAIGLYGLVSHSVSQRRAEIGIRMALGATISEVNRMVLFQGIKPALAGVVLGLLAAVFAARVLQSQLFGVTPIDPLTFAAVPFLLLTIALLAGIVPTLRAGRVDPIVVLRQE
jgi:predicted permease